MNSPLGELILYRTDDGRTEVHLRAAEGTVWMTQGEMAELFDTTKQNISLHVRNVLKDGELRAEGTVKDYLTVQTEGRRTVNRSVQLYRLEMILAVGFRVRSPRGSQFRRWAGDALSEYLVKGFLLDDERLKDAERADYFKELLQRIRDIRSSEKRFYQTLRELFKVSSSDYDGSAATAKTFFATIQNKLVYAVTGRTAAQLIVERADSNAPHMGLTNWTGDNPASRMPSSPRTTCFSRSLNSSTASSRCSWISLRIAPSDALKPACWTGSGRPIASLISTSAPFSMAPVACPTNRWKPSPPNVTQNSTRHDVRLQ